MGRGRPLPELKLAAEENNRLVEWTRRHKTSQALAVRAGIVLSCAQGTPNMEVASHLRVSKQMVGKWRFDLAARQPLDKSLGVITLVSTDADLAVGLDAIHHLTGGVALRGAGGLRRAPVHGQAMPVVHQRSHTAHRCADGGRGARDQRRFACELHSASMRQISKALL